MRQRIPIRREMWYDSFLVLHFSNSNFVKGTAMTDLVAKAQVVRGGEKPYRLRELRCSALWTNRYVRYEEG
jgi:hypothetical protein